MKTIDVGIILGTLAFAFYLPVTMTTSHQTLKIPEKLQLAHGRVIVNATPCTVTCGLGYKEEETCEVGPDGVKRECETHQTECQTNWICGMVHFTVPVGKKFELTCLSSDILHYGHEAFRFTWKFAYGIVSTDDELFKPFQRHIHSVIFTPAQELDSGTYRCDVQLLRNLKFVKRIYFALRVIPSNLVNLNFDQSLSEEQKLMDEGMELDQGNQTHFQHVKQTKKAWVVLGVGITVGVLGGMLFSTVLYSLMKISNRKVNTEI
ncbi:transmembrane protein 81 [Monodelphis domestica]|uniref:transmembrane protein 81 n=1 Tax=Monodelphis domestica TaxID=13616 RepID=UPI0024E19D04|nr:transmembrane protein 81 [Monodelphis domestica]